MQEELISIIIPTYNRSDILANISALSVISQSYKNWELLIVDDGSKDDTRKVCEELIAKDKRIKYFYKENGGQGSARNLGLNNSSGEYVVLLDSDDYLLPDMLKIMSSHIGENKIEMIACKRWVFNYKKGIFDINAPNPSCVLYKKSLFKDLGYFNEDRSLVGIEDADLGITWDINQKKLNYSYSKIFINEPLVIYLEHENQATNHSDLEKLRLRTLAIVEKYKNNELYPKGEMPLKFKELGNFDLLLGRADDGRINLKKSLKIKINSQALILLLISYLGVGTYFTIVKFIKLIREKIFWRIRLVMVKNKFKNLYLEALNITKNYKNW